MTRQEGKVHPDGGLPTLKASSPVWAIKCHMLISWGALEMGAGNDPNYFFVSRSEFNAP